MYGVPNHTCQFDSGRPYHQDSTLGEINFQLALVLFYKTVKSRDEETLRFAPILRDGGFSSYDLKTKLKPNQIKDL